MTNHVTKTIDPDDILEKEVGTNGQIAIGRDLAGETVLVAYEVGGEPDADAIEPDEIVEKTTNESGQIYLGRDLAGGRVAVAYEVRE